MSFIFIKKLIKISSKKNFEYIFCDVNFTSLFNLIAKMFCATVLHMRISVANEVKCWHVIFC